MLKNYIISITQKDRTGIISEVTSIIQELNGNLEDISQTVIRGYFSMILLVSFKNDIQVQELSDKLSRSMNCNDCAINILPYDAKDSESAPHSATNTPEQNLYMLTAVGPDQSGIVAAVSTYLKRQNINICDLTTCISPEGEYTMIMEISIPDNSKISILKNDIRNSLKHLNLDIELRNCELFRKTNEI